MEPAAYIRCVAHGDYCVKAPPVCHKYWHLGDWVRYIRSNGRFFRLDYWHRVANQKAIR